MLAAAASDFGFNSRESAVFGRLTSPERIQQFLDEKVVYDPGMNCRSPRLLLRDRRGHCVEGALFAAVALRVLGHPPLILDLAAQRDDDHVIAVFRRHGLWGAIGKSNFTGLRYREPVYRNIRELVMSYFEHYFNARGERTLRGYSRPVNLARFDARAWMTSREEPWYIPEYLVSIPHRPLLPRKAVSRLTLLDPRMRAAGKFGMLA